MRRNSPHPHVHRQDAPDLQKLPADALLNRRQLAALSGYALITLQVWAAKGRGPKITRVEGRPRYRAEDVRNWMGLASGAGCGALGATRADGGIFG